MFEKEQFSKNGLGVKQPTKVDMPKKPKQPASQPTYYFWGDVFPLS